METVRRPLGREGTLSLAAGLDENERRAFVEGSSKDAPGRLKTAD
jgi:hypothetical protein